MLCLSHRYFSTFHMQVGAQWSEPPLVDAEAVYKREALHELLQHAPKINTTSRERQRSSFALSRAIAYSTSVEESAVNLPGDGSFINGSHVLSDGRFTYIDASALHIQNTSSERGCKSKPEHSVHLCKQNTECMVIVHLPELKSADDVVLHCGARHAQVHAPGREKLACSLPMRCNADSATASWRKKSHQLVVRLDVA